MGDPWAVARPNRAIAPQVGLGHLQTLAPEWRPYVVERVNKERTVAELLKGGLQQDIVVTRNLLEQLAKAIEPLVRDLGLATLPIVVA
eukprot:5265441-Alexandrium_andersonii.AAC.1